MAELTEVRVPDIGDFKGVDVIEVYVSSGDRVEVESPLICLESEKATMDIPSPHAGTVREVVVAVGDKVSQGTPILKMEVADAAPKADPKAEKKTETPADRPEKPAAPAGKEETAEKRTPARAAGPPPEADLQAEVLVLGSGPGGYTAAFRAADLGKKVVLVERYPTLGGVCLNVGCIPSKALLHLAEVIAEIEELSARGVEVGAPKFDLDKIRAFKREAVDKLTGGLAKLAKQRKVKVLQGKGTFTSPHTLAVEGEGGATTVGFESAIIAVGSRPVRLPFIPHDDPRVMDSTSALEVSEIPGRMLVVGGGIIGLEMATVYDALGAKITVVELMDQIIPGCDPDLVRPLFRRIKRRYENIFLETKVAAVEAKPDGLHVRFEGKKVPESDVFDRILVAVGRRPNGADVGAETAGVAVTKAGFIEVDAQQRTNVAHIYAIGDVVGQPMLAHKATHEGKVAAEVIAGLPAAFDPRAIPSVAYTDPEVAWMGLTETEAKRQGVEVEVASFPWAASGRALGMGRNDGLTKLVLDKETRRVLGAGIVGPRAGELIAETVLAREMGADAEDLGLTIHPHPTLSETLAFAAEVAEGTATDVYAPKKGK